MTDQDALTAIHEASHCCLFEAWGMCIDGVTIDPGADYLGKVFRRDYEYGLDDLQKAIRATIALAGAIGEGMLESTGDVPLSADDGDMQRYLSLGLPDEMFDPLVQFTEGILFEHWPKVEQLAALLLHHRTLAPETVGAVLDGVYQYARYYDDLQQVTGLCPPAIADLTTA